MTNNISFLISLHIDSSDRIDNLDISVDYLQYYFPDSEIILSELDETSKIKNRYNKCKHIFTKSNGFFNRQKGVNIAAKNSNNSIISLYDADILIKPTTINKAINLIQNNTIDICYPYNGFFYDIPKTFHNSIKENRTIEDISTDQCKLLSDRSVGGVVFFKKDVFWRGGGANERFQGLGYEDNELFERYKKLEFSIGRINTSLFHLTHERKNTSFDYNPFGSDNQKEFIRICNMSKDELLNEIKTW